jgi:vacuolar-type H+-ATPase subunit I/STV1
MAWRMDSLSNLTECLNLDDVDETASSSLQNETETHECWTDEQSKLMMDSIDYKGKNIQILQDEIALIVRARKYGPIDLMYKPKFTRLSKPKGDVEDIMFMEASKNKKKTNTVKKSVRISKMADEELIEYLNGLISSEISIENKSDKMPTGNIAEMGKHLQQSHAMIKTIDNQSLNMKLAWGKNLSKAKKIYNVKKSKGEYWNTWITKTLNFSRAYVDKCMLMHRFVKIYPKLSKLKITFAELYSLKKKLTEIFEKNKKIADEWKHDI